MARPVLTTTRVEGLAAAGKSIVTVEEQDLLRSNRPINYLAVDNQSGQLVQVILNGLTELNFYLVSGRSFEMSDEIEINTVEIRNEGSGAFNTTGAFVTLGRVKQRRDIVVEAR